MFIEEATDRATAAAETWRILGIVSERIASPAFQEEMGRRKRAKEAEDAARLAFWERYSRTIAPSADEFRIYTFLREQMS